jgi:DNA polymerase III delta subunit
MPAVTPSTPTRPAGSATAEPVAYFWGDDAYGIDVAVEAMRNDRARFPAGVPDRWRIRGDATESARVLGELRERLATGTMFGSGTLAVLSNAGPLVRRGEDREALVAAIGMLADGNGLVIAEETDSGRKEPPSKVLSDAVRSAGGVVRRFEAPREGGLAAWIEARARERGIALGPGAARELATRIGGFVREGDVDRREQGRLAVMELEKLALRHAVGPSGAGGSGAIAGLDVAGRDVAGRDVAGRDVAGRDGPARAARAAAGGPVTADDVRDLVAEAIPGSIWGFVDAIGMRQRSRSLELLERLLEATPEPVLLAVLHRRIRELIEVADRLASGETPGSLVRSMRLQPFRAETLARQARAWTVGELSGALEGLLELDALVKGVGGAAAGGSGVRLAFDLWVADRVAPTG